MKILTNVKNYPEALKVITDKPHAIPLVCKIVCRNNKTVQCSVKKGGFQLFPKRQILDFSKLKEFADDNFEFHVNGGNFSKRGRKRVGNGEIDRYVFPFPTMSLKDLYCKRRKTKGLFGKGVNGPP